MGSAVAWEIFRESFVLRQFTFYLIKYIEIPYSTKCPNLCLFLDNFLCFKKHFTIGSTSTLTKNKVE